jgi:ubiquinone/menaquinone biosynthesis C-methylase UbiE
MFNNFINSRDLVKLAGKITDGTLAEFLFRIKIGKKDRVRAVWTNRSAPPSSCWDIPEVIDRWNYLISGDKNVDFYNYITNKFLSGKSDLTALSLGSGNGCKELIWAKTGKFRKIDAYDLSESIIQTAKKDFAYGDVINYCALDVNKIELPENSYDIVFGQQSLHHFEKLESLFLKIDKCLKPGGYFIVNDFAGPTRFQWTDRQLQAVNALLAILPEKYKTHWNSGSVKNRAYRPSRLGMILIDPSEAVESAKIRPLLNEVFNVVEIREYRGAVLHVLFDKIAHNFVVGDEESKRYLKLCFDVEDLLSESGELQSDLIAAVCEKSISKGTGNA